jgi:hypothetical protein
LFTVIGLGNATKLLAKALKCKRNNVNADIAINWGLGKKEIHQRARFPEVINNTEAIKNTSNKYEQNRKMQRDLIRVPKASTDTAGLTFPIIGRSFYHTQGQDMVFIESEEDIVPCDYYIEFIPIKKERRYHVVRDKIENKYKVISASYKYGGSTEGKGRYCRNFKTGWKFSEYAPEPNLATIAVEAVKSTRLDFGAVDLIIGEDNKIYVLEINSAPGLIEKRATAYANAFKGIFPEVNYSSDTFDSMRNEVREAIEENPQTISWRAEVRTAASSQNTFIARRTVFESTRIEATTEDEAREIIEDGDIDWDWDDEELEIVSLEV